MNITESEAVREFVDYLHNPPSDPAALNDAASKAAISLWYVLHRANDRLKVDPFDAMRLLDLPVDGNPAWSSLRHALRAFTGPGKVAR